jgi:CDP-3, 6-dideoxy-D-glycero-L-glycero-4-hexulose-4-reductase
MSSVGTAVVTGASSYLASRLLQLLLQNHWRVVALARTPIDRWKAPPPASRLLLPVQTDAHGWSECLRKERPDVVFHLAGDNRVGSGEGDIRRLCDANFTNGTVLLEAMREAGVRRGVFAMTFWQHFEGKLDHPFDLYAATRAALVPVLRFFASCHRLSVWALELHDTYGPGDFRGKIVSKLFEAARSGEPIALSLPHQRLDLVHADDVARAFLHAAHRPVSDRGEFRRYSVASGKPVTMRSLVRQVAEAVGASIDVRWECPPSLKKRVMVPTLVISQLPGWKARVSLREGLAELAAERNGRHT